MGGAGEALFQGQHGNVRCPKGPMSLASTLAWQQPLHCPAPPVVAAWSWVWFFPADCELQVRQNLCKIRQVHGGPLRIKEENSSDGGDGCEYWEGTEEPVVLIISFHSQ